MYGDVHFDLVMHAYESVCACVRACVCVCVHVCLSVYDAVTLSITATPVG